MKWLIKTWDKKFVIEGSPLLQENGGLIMRDEKTGSDTVLVAAFASGEWDYIFNEDYSGIIWEQDEG